MPIEVIKEAERVAAILVENYNQFNTDGGYILIMTPDDEINCFFNEVLGEYISPDDFEFADGVKTSSEHDYASILYLIGTEYSISVIMPLCIAPQSAKEYINHNNTWR